MQVSEDAPDGLVHHLPGLRRTEAGLRDAADDLGARDGFAEYPKVDVLRAVEAWQDEVAPPDFGPDLEELLQALHQDVSGKTFRI